MHGADEAPTPYGEKASRKSLYSIEDNMFRFWYRIVLENDSLIARGAADPPQPLVLIHLNMEKS